MGIRLASVADLVEKQFCLKMCCFIGNLYLIDWLNSFLGAWSGCCLSSFIIAVISSKVSLRLFHISFLLVLYITWCASVCTCLDLAVYSLSNVHCPMLSIQDGKSAYHCLSAFIQTDATTVVGNYGKWSKLNICSCVTIYR